MIEIEFTRFETALRFADLYTFHEKIRCCARTCMHAYVRACSRDLDGWRERAKFPTSIPRTSFPTNSIAEKQEDVHYYVYYSRTRIIVDTFERPTW